MKNLLALVVQILLLVAINQLGYWAAALLPFPVPGNMLGMLVLFALLASGIVPLSWIEQGASLLIRHLALFLIPIVVGLMSFGGLFLESGLPILLTLAVSIVVGLAVTGVVSQPLIKREKNRARECPDHGV